MISNPLSVNCLAAVFPLVKSLAVNNQCGPIVLVDYKFQILYPGCLR